MSKYAKVTLEELQLETIDLPLGSFILMSSEKLLTSTRLGITKILKEEFLFAISLLDITIQDSGIKERSDSSRVNISHYLNVLYLFYINYHYILQVYNYIHTLSYTLYICLDITFQRLQSWLIKRNLVLGLNTRELDRELCTGMSIFYTKGSWSVLCTSSLP